MSKFRIYNETLCPDLWDAAQHLNPEVRLSLLKMAYDFYEKTNLPAKMLDVYLMGSIANYNWTADSDTDVHVIIDYTKLQMPEDAATKTVKTAGAQWNLEHNVMVKGHKVEMNIQNSAEQKPYVTGIYSLVKDQWIRKPLKMAPNVDANVIRTQYDSMKSYIMATLNSRNRETMKAAKKYLDAYRQYGLDTYGELSYENIIFKILRASGIIKQLKDSITAVYDQQMSVDEVGAKSMKQTLPKAPIRYADSGLPRLEMLTLDNLNGLRAKAARMVKGTSGKEDTISKEINQYAMQDFIRYNAEIKRRLEIINRPITESPMMSKKGKQALAGDKPLKNQSVEEVIGNIFVVRESRGNSFLAEGWTMVFFMDSEESAEAIRRGEIPYLMVPIGTFSSGGDPITDIWKKRFHKPGTEHILGVIQGHSDTQNIFIDMITVRPGWQRNHIAKLMLDRLKKTFPEANVSTSKRTPDGEKFAKGVGITECGVGAGIPEDDRLNIKNTDGSTRRWQVRSKDAPKTPKMTDTPPKAIKKYDKPIALNEATLRGEWWIQDGQAMFADGDVGDMNHEAYVIDKLKYEIFDGLGVDIGGYDNAPDFSDMRDEIFEEIGNDLTPEEREAWENDEYITVIAAYLTRNGDSSAKEKLLYIRGHDEEGKTLDARRYALKHWGWQRVQGNVVQTESLTSNDLKNITNGLWDAYEDQLDNPETTFNIEVFSTRSTYSDIPWHVLQKDDPTALNQYRSRY